MADSTHSREGEGCRKPLQSSCSHRLPTISMERMAATEACTASTSIEPNSLHHKGFSSCTPKNLFTRAGRETRSPQTSR
ncbi:hypothetical protein [Variovorax boronicumulans]|uniref:hypothetical protein n=1 Tax=Variovorax boronicumulans TaxID=436515 RepID=UPI00132F8C07|nr:hypothetical protein [Variovorax boronicumulans]